MTTLPIQYHLEVYERSYANDPSFSASTSTPTPVFRVGDLLDARGFDRWVRPPGPTEIFRVVEIRHALWEAKEHVGHKVMIRVETVPDPHE